MRRTSVLFRQRTCLAAAGVPRSTTGSTQKVPVQFRKEKFHPYFPRFLQEESVCTHSRSDRRDGYRSHVRKQCIESVPENGSKSGNQRFGEKNDPYGAGASRENFRFHSCCFYFLLVFLTEEILPYPLQGMKKTGERQRKTEITPIRRFPNASLRVRTLSRIHSLSSPGKVDILLYDRRFF